jgi:ubiquinone/menaquinone biosynthesis C-methylase UbiE
MDYLDYQKETWDSLATESGEHPLRAVISEDDLNNYYVDKTQKRLFKEVIKIKRDFKVLDLGCGVGRWTLWFAPQVKRVVGVDLSPNMIKIAKKRAISSNIKNTEFFVIEDSLKIFKDNEFDMVTCVWVLKYILNENDLKQMIKEICRVTKVGGYVAIIEQVDYNGPIPCKEDLSKSLLRPSDYYISLFEDCGMKPIKRYTTINYNIFFGLYSTIRKKLKIENHYKIDQHLSKIAVDISCYFDKLMKKHIKKTGHHFFYFRKIR